MLEQYITDRFDVLRLPGGGFIFNTGHMVQPDVAPCSLIWAYTVAILYGPTRHHKTL